MITLEHAEINWLLNGHCKLQCSYCRPEWKSGPADRPLQDYLDVIGKLQSTRYRHHTTALWKIGGGEPLHFPHLTEVLQAIKKLPSILRLDTSGDDTYFAIYRILHLIDWLHLTYHEWQNDDVVGFILDECKARDKKVTMEFPLIPGRINETREKINYYQQLGYECTEQILYEPDGRFIRTYSQVDVNRIFRRSDEATTENTTPVYTDLSIINSIDPVYTGLPCYAGVDWIHINPKGFASYSQCGGRNEHFNVFDPNWKAPGDHFACTVGQCRNVNDRKKIRISETMLIAKK